MKKWSSYGYPKVNLKSIKKYLSFFVKNRPKVLLRKINECSEWMLKTSVKTEKEGQPQVIYITGLPRTGTSLLKNYLASKSIAKSIPFQEKGFHKAWSISEENCRPILDKATHYITNLGKIYETYGDNVGFIVVVRDPRDQIISLRETYLHLEISRSYKFSNTWVNTLENTLKFRERCKPCWFKLIKYEDFVDNSSLLLNELSKDMNIEILQDYDKNYEIAHDNDSQDHKVVKHKNIHTKSVGRYQNVTDNDTLRIVKRIEQKEDVQKYLKMFNYK